jgi:integrase
MRRNLLPPENASATDTPSRWESVHLPWKTGTGEPQIGIPHKRHYFASLLIADGAGVKTVQARLRHASAKTTFDTYGHIWPDRDESTRAAVDAVLAAYRTEQRRNSWNPGPGTAGQGG